MKNVREAIVKLKGRKVGIMLGNATRIVCNKSNINYRSSVECTITEIEEDYFIAKEENGQEHIFAIKLVVHIIL